MIILGVICLVFWSLGAWFRKIANQSADFCERIVEAQFAAHTKNLKSRRRDQDAQFLAERVIDPELLLRSSDDRIDDPGRRRARTRTASRPGRVLFENRELAFLRNVRLLYQDYLDGSPLHRSDTKASIQLLGNLALTNLRRSHLRHLLRESRTLDRLDLSRSGGLLRRPLPLVQLHHAAARAGDGAPDPRLQPPRDPGGPAGLLARADPSRVPVLAGRPAQGRPGGGLAAGAVRRPTRTVGHGPAGRAHPTGARAERTAPCRCGNRRRREADAFLETVEFTAVDFLADDPERDAEIHARFGPQVAELVRRDRQQNVRRAFRSFPLHELPRRPARSTRSPSTRPTSPAAGSSSCRSTSWSRSPAAWASPCGASTASSTRSSIPQVDQDRTVPSDTYWAALRKIHRMRKPVFMGSLWLRARFDVEYLGLPLPTAPPGIAAESLMETDLDYIGATRQDRIIAEQVRRQHQGRLEWVGRWLERFGWTFDELPAYLAREIPFLANRGGEALRALVAACVLDHDDIATLALSIEGLKRVLAHAADPRAGPRDASRRASPSRSSTSGRSGTRSIACRRPAADLFDLPVLPRLRRRPSGGGSSATSAAIAAPSGAGSRSSSAREAPTPGRPSRPGCATSCSAPTSGATRSWSSAPSRA